MTASPYLPKLVLLPAAVFALCLAFPLAGWSQEQAPDAETATDAAAEVTVDKSLSPADQERAERLFQSAYRFFLNEKYAEALQKLDELNQLAPENSSVVNLIGAIKTKQGKYDEAVTAFQKAAEFAPDDFRPRFNIAEVAFLQKDYGKARAGFEKLLEEDPTNELAAYKVYLTYLLEDNDAMANLSMKSFDEFSDWPTYYFANAAKAFDAGRVDEGQDWIISARKIYPGNRNALYAETMLDLGWIEQEHFDRIKVTAREAVIDFDQPLQVPKEIAKDLGMLRQAQQRKRVDGKAPTATKPFEASQADVNLEEE
ncbi:MAG: tetratricopeptide repeat protein [Verrucomicrobiota bacterium]